MQQPFDICLKIFVTAATIANCQATVPGQSTTSIIRANSTVVASNSMITVTEIRPEVRPTAPPTSLLIQASSKPQSKL